MKDKLLTPEELSPATEICRKIVNELNKILLGKDELHRKVLAALISRGHILFEGLPGVGKTALVKAVGEILSLDFRRIQFTPDLMPSDILGTNILQEREDGEREMVFREGPVFTNILLADEINRASPKTQSALLEAMQESTVTLLNVTRRLPSPFFVLASQNPIEMEGTYPIPEAQLDRFLFKLNVRSVSADTLNAIITTRRRGIPPEPEWRAERKDVELLFEMMERIVLPEAVASYISRLVAATHPESGAEEVEGVSEYISYGASPRAAIALAEASRAVALINGRPSVGFEDVKSIIYDVLNHRLILNYKAKIDRVTAEDVIGALVDRVEEVDLNFSGDISVA